MGKKGKGGPPRPLTTLSARIGKEKTKSGKLNFAMESPCQGWGRSIRLARSIGNKSDCIG